MAPTSIELATNLTRIHEGMARAAARSGRLPEEIRLIAVSKMHSASQIREAYEAGIRHFGENRVQEWELKHTQLTNLDATWHMIGHLQGNKAARAVRLFDTMDAVDTIALAERLDRAKKELAAKRTVNVGKAETTKAEGRGARLPVLIEVKLDPAVTKSGARNEDLPRLVEAILSFSHLQLRGLMGVPPYFDDPEQARPYFRHLRKLRDSIRAQLGRELLPALSMGMSQDFEVAIEEGATEIRIGTALFGERRKA